MKLHIIQADIDNAVKEAKDNLPSGICRSCVIAQALIRTFKVKDYHVSVGISTLHVNTPLIRKNYLLGLDGQYITGTSFRKWGTLKPVTIQLRPVNP